MFHLYHHHDLERLAELLAALRERDGGSPLAPDTVLVPNHGLGRWLKMRLAESEGVAANIDMPLPARFFWRVLADSLPGDEADSSAYERANLRWHLYAHLPAIGEAVPEVKRYLQGPTPELRRLQLAEQLADVFDQYLIYRRDMLLAWESGRGEGRPPADWQAPVWRALVERLGPRHRARLLGELVERVESGGELDRGSWPERVYCFSLGNLPPDYLRLLYAMGRHADVHFLLQNPSDVYWGDIERRPVSLADPVDADPPPGEDGIARGHPLLASLGYAQRDFLRVLYADELSGILEPELGEAMAYEPPGEDTLLHRVQSGVIRMAAEPDDRGLEPGDASLQVHACHGPLREVQVLHDQLLDLMARDPQLEPRDVLVMVPDMSAYAPAIHAVFGAAEGAARIPYNVSDRPRTASHPIALTFRELLDLPLSRWTASEVMALASVPAVMRRHGLDEADLDNLRHWLDEAGVRWGLDAETREAAGAGRWEQNTWRFGLDRLLAGLAQSDGETLVDGVAPWTDLEGGAASAVGRLWLLIDRLRRWSERLAEPATAAQWHERLNALTAELFRPDPEDRDERAALDAVHEAVAVLGDAAASLGEEPLSWEAVREVLDSELSDAGERQPFLAGGVTFCGMVPLRAAPFRVVCLLGMDDGAFPRQDRGRALNLIRRFPRLGDHSVRDDDRLLFLQSLLAARDVFYVSYTGQDMRSGEELAPSPVVGELLDFLARYHFAGSPRDEAVERLVTRQPMQPFSPRYFRACEPPRVFTFRGAWRAGTEAMFAERGEAPRLVDGSRASEPAPEQLDLADLKAFWDHPPRHFFREIVRLDLDEATRDLSDEEPRGLDGLTGHLLRRELFDRACRQGELSPQPDALIRARGVLPPPPLDSGEYAEQVEQVNALLPVWQRWHDTEETPGSAGIDCALPCGMRLTGRVAGVWPDGLRRVYPGKLNMRHRLAHWIDYLALLASGGEGRLRVAGLDGGEPMVLAAGLDRATAVAHLDALVSWYLEGRREPLCFLPDQAGRFMEDRSEHWTKKPKSPDKALKDRNGHFANEHFPPWEIDRDRYFPLVLSPAPHYLGETAADSAFTRLAEAVVGPVVEHLLPANEEADG